MFILLILLSCIIFFPKPWKYCLSPYTAGLMTFPLALECFSSRVQFWFWRLQPCCMLISVAFLQSYQTILFPLFFDLFLQSVLTLSLPFLCRCPTWYQFSHNHHKILWRLQTLLTTDQYSCPYSGFPKDSVLCLCLICFISFCSVLGCSKSFSYNTESSPAASSPSLSTVLGVTSTSWIN